MTNRFSTTRRMVLGGVAAIAAVPLMAAVPAFAAPGNTSAIGVLWAQAETVRQELMPYAEKIAAAHARTGLPGWMHVAGRANTLGSHRYDLMVAMLKCEAVSKDDLALLAKVTVDHDMVNGPKSWAHGRFDLASVQVHSRAV